MFSSLLKLQFLMSMVTVWSNAIMVAVWLHCLLTQLLSI